MPYLQVLLIAILLAPLHVAVAQVGGDDIILSLQEHQIKSAGIDTWPIKKESGAGELVVPGTIAVPPRQLRLVAAPAAGLVETLLVSPDEDVKEGDPIATLKSSELVEAQRAFLQAVSDAALATERLRRDEQLHKEHIIAERRLLVTRAEATQARAALEERSQLLALDGMTEKDIEVLRNERRLVPSLLLRAPISGTILYRHGTVGDRVQAAAPLVTIARLNPIWVNLQVPINRAPALDRADRVVIPSLGIEGRLIRIGRTADQSTQSVNAVAEFLPGKVPTRPGQAVQAILRLLGNGAPQWRVPADAVVHYRDNSWIFVRTSDGFRATPVTLLFETPQYASIQAPLNAQDRVATRGILTLLAELAARDK